jgi:hypothetical protein
MDTFPELVKLTEEIGFLLERFDFTVHNDESNVEHVEQAKRALADLEGAIGDLIP